MSDWYPPAFVGGYELICESVVTGLRERGHDVRVLTSRRQPESDESYVRAVLTPYHPLGYPERGVSLVRRAWIELRDQRLVRAVHRAFRPHITLLFNGGGLLRSVVATTLGGRPVVPVLGDLWYFLYPDLEYDAWFSGWSGVASTPLRRLIGRIAVGLRPLAGAIWNLELAPARLEHAIFVSKYLRRAYASIDPAALRGAVIYNGLLEAIEDSVNASSARTDCPGSCRLLCAGRIVPEKGIHTLIDALAQARVRIDQRVDLSLTIAGPQPDREYLNALGEYARDLGLEPLVRIEGARSPDRMPNLYRRHDVLCFPSIGPEGFGNTIIEAQWFGLPVIAFGVGGTPEAMADGRTGIVVPPGDAQAFGDAIVAYACNPGRAVRDGAAGAAFVRERFARQRMIDEVEAHLNAVLARHRDGGRHA